MKTKWEFLVQRFMHNKKGQMLEESTMNRQGPIKEFLPGPKSKSWNRCLNVILRRLLLQHDCQLLRLAPFETSFHYCRQSDVSFDFCDQYQLIFLIQQVAGRRREGCRQNRLPWIFLQGDPVRGDPSKTSGLFFKNMIASFRTQANCFFQTVCFSYILIIRIKIWHRFRHPVASSCKLFLSSSLHSQNVFQALSMVGDISRWQLWRPLATMGPVLWEGMQTVMSLSRWQIGGWNIN